MSGALYVRQLKLGPMDNFVYLVGQEGAPEVTVVDPAWDLDAIEQAAAQDGKRIVSAFVSHCHHDHINGLPELLRRHDVPVYAQRAEIDFSPRAPPGRWRRAEASFAGRRAGDRPVEGEGGAHPRSHARLAVAVGG